MTEVSIVDILRPFLWAAAFGFVVGFAGYVLVVGGMDQTYARMDGPGQVARMEQASTPLTTATLTAI
ncbi:MAG: hypothetical protein V4514_22520 [Pseudomonadota bacterium]|uniref:hypothetical protein n=1 Tax=unclassified Phenylobacterium TaxID=2640670 RepID=UPI0006F26E84|nr:MULTISPECIES: hypothetical protein [unclassified Phenylobacterium]KRB52308.1 hypothetical protein ASE02_12400 [Phenylobacterium sp. Root700]MBT9471471.1 hypothetical protein [Phenylobacterium sp.]